MLNKMLSMIPDALAKSKESNLGKLFIIISDELVKLTEAANAIEDWRDIDLAQGESLDRIGKEYDQHRGQDSDALYRFMIKSKIEQAQSNGTFNELINVICRTINCEPSDVNIVSGRFYDENDQYVGEPLAVEIKSVPMRFFSDTNIKVSAFIDSVRASVAAGVHIISISIEDITAVEINYKRTIYKIAYDGFSGDGSLTGEFPGISTIGAFNQQQLSLDYANAGFVIQPPLIGEEPFVNRIAVISNQTIESSQMAEGFIFDASPEGLTGEIPMQNMLASIGANKTVPEISTVAYSYQVDFSGEDDF